MSEQVLERFHRALIEEIQTQRPEYLTAAFTVAEIYQNLVPYGSHRDRIGVEMNGDYEDALIRLLAGEGGYLILDSEPALRDLRAELEMQNPNTGLYREYAAVDVRLNQAYLDLSAAAMDQLPDLVEELEAEDPVAMAELAPSEGTVTATEMGIVPPGVDIFAEPEGEPAEEVSVTTSEAEDSPHVAPVEDEAEDQGEPDEEALGAAGRPLLAPEYVETPGENGGPAPADTGGGCLWCGTDLPDREPLNFCPFCGIDLKLVPCPACGEEIEPGWRFCGSCGTEVRR